MITIQVIDDIAFDVTKVYSACAKYIPFTPPPSQGDEGDNKSQTVPMEEEEDDDNDPENRYDSIRKDFKKIITHPRRGRKQEQRNSKQVVKTRSACLVKTRSQASRKFERGARKQTPKSRNEKKLRK